MFIPNPNSENIFVFDNVADFAEAVTRFVRGVNVFWKSGTTYDMMTSYVGGALVGAKYTVDASGASETPGGGGGATGLVTNITVDGEFLTLDKTFGEIKSAMLSGTSVIAVLSAAGQLMVSPILELDDSSGEKSVVVAAFSGQPFNATADTDYPSTRDK